MVNRKYDIVVYGATGFTGNLVAQYLARTTALPPDRWAIAGRNRSKLESVRTELAGIDPGLAALDMIQADSGDLNALQQMSAQTSVIVTTVGPYALYGESLVKACVSTGTHCLDITGEPNFVADILKKYGAEAKKNKVLIINCCGFDSIPADLGAWYTAKQFTDKNQLTIKAFVKSKGQFSGGTWASALNAMAEGLDRDKTEKSSKSPTRLKRSIHRDARTGRWAVPMPVIDPWIVRRTAEAHPEVYGSDFQYGHYLGIRGLPSVAGLLAGVGLIYAGAQITPIRKLMMNFRKSGEGPDAEQRAKHFFQITFFAKSSTESVKAWVRGGDPGYTETSKMLAESALTVVKHYTELDQQGGVTTPAGALGDHLLERLQAAGIEFGAEPLA